MSQIRPTAKSLSVLTLASLLGCARCGAGTQDTQGDDARRTPPGCRDQCGTVTVCGDPAAVNGATCTQGPRQEAQR